MSGMRLLFRRLWYAAWGVAAVLVILTALLFSVLRLVLPYAADYKGEIETQASVLLKHEVKISHIEPDWRWLTPRLRLIGIRIADQKTATVQFRLNEIAVGLDLFGTVMAFSPRIVSIDVVGADVTLERNEKDEILIQGLRISVQQRDGDKVFMLPDFFNDKTIRLVDSHVLLRDKGMEYDLQSLSVSLAKHGDRHQLFLVSQLPQAFGQRLEVGMDFIWNASGIERLQGHGYIRGKAINLAQIQSFYPQFDRLRSGYADFELWLNMRQKRVESVKGLLQLSGVELQSADTTETWALSLLETKMHLLRQKNGALLVLQDLRLKDQKHISQTSDMIASLVTDAGNDVSGLQLYTDYLRVDDFLPAVKMLPGISEKLYSLLSRYAAQGSLSDLTLKWDAGQADQGAALMLAAGFDDLAIQGQEWIPSFTGLSGQVFMGSHGKGKLSLSSQHMEVHYPKLFHDVVSISQLSANLRFVKRPDGLLLQSEDVLLDAPHLKTQSHLKLWAPTGVKPFLELQGRLEIDDMAYTNRYLPTGIMSANLVHWLNNGISKGQLANGKYEIKGWCANFPFRDKPGLFKAEAEFGSVDLLYSSKWPAAKNLSGRLRFDGPGLFIDGYTGHIFAADLTDMGMAIADLKQGFMQLDLKASASMQDSLRFIRESPLRKTFAAIVDDVEADGYQNTVISLNIPLAEKSLHVFSHHGRMDISEGRLSFPKWGLNFSGIDNQVSYADHQVDMLRKPVLFNGRSVDMEITTKRSGQQSSMQVKLEGSLSLQSILQKQKPFWLRYVRGNSDFESVLKVPFKRTDDENVQSSITLRSNLVGITATLPAPFQKDAVTPNYTVIEGRFLPESQVEIEAVFSDWLHGKLLLETGAGEVQLKKSDVRLRNGLARLGPFGGITVSGKLDRFDYDEWQRLLTESPLKEAGGVLDSLKEVRLDVGDFTYLGYHLKSANLTIIPSVELWKIRVESAAVNGSVEVPRQEKSALPLNVQLQSLDMNILRQDHVGGEAGNPAKLPSIQFAADKVALNDWRLQQVSFTSMPMPDGLKIHSLTVADPDLQVQAEGEWRVRADAAQQTHLHIHVDSKNAGAALGKLGYAQFIREGRGTSEFDLGWAGSPAEFSFAGLKGSGKMAFREGQILEFDPGAGGRIFGLISLQMLPRRLSLDFKDLTGKGLRFDKMRGDFTFVDGNAYTSNFYIDGPVGRIDIQGRAGLVARDYAQTVIFLPDLSSSLPVLGALLGGASGGLGVIVVDRIARLFGKQVDHLGRVKYSVTGSWDAPVIEQIKAAKKKSNAKKNHAQTRQDDGK